MLPERTCIEPLGAHVDPAKDNDRATGVGAPIDCPADFEVRVGPTGGLVLRLEEDGGVVSGDKPGGGGGAPLILCNCSNWDPGSRSLEPPIRS